MYDDREIDELEFEDASDEDIDDDDIPSGERHLRTQAYDKSISDIIAMINRKDLILDPDYQRNYVWENKKASLLIESVLLNVPLPIIYVAEESEGEWSVIDGLQRLNALNRYFAGEYKLTGLEVLKELQGQVFSTLPPKAQRILKNGILRVILILKESHTEIKYDIFMRLNRGSVRLNEQELRNCLYRGAFNELLKALRQNAKLLKILGLKNPHKRMSDAEIILRYFAVSENFDRDSNKINKYGGKMKSLLNRYMENANKMLKDGTKTSNDYSLKFESTIDKVYAVFGDKAFRRYSTSGYERNINRAIMDCITVGFEDYDIEKLRNKKENIIDLLSTLPQRDSTFSDAINLGTSEKKKLEYRLQAWSRALRTIMDSTK